MRGQVAAFAIVVSVGALGCGSKAQQAEDAAPDSEYACVLAQKAAADLERKLAEAKRAEDVAKAKAEYKRSKVEPYCDGKMRRGDPATRRQINGITPAERGAAAAARPEARRT
jgi:hypothetical protein